MDIINILYRILYRVYCKERLSVHSSRAWRQGERERERRETRDRRKRGERERREKAREKEREGEREQCIERLYTVFGTTHYIFYTVWIKLCSTCTGNVVM